MRSTTLGRAAYFSAVSVLLYAGAANAASVVYSDRATFDAASSGLTVIDFEGLIPAGSDTRGYSAVPTDIGGVIFQSLDLNVISPSRGGGAYTLGSGDALVGSDYVTATMGSGVRAVGADFGSSPVGSEPGAVTASYEITLSTGETFTGTVPIGNDVGTFIGFTSSTADIVSIKYDPTSGGFLKLDNFTFGNVAATEASGTPLPAAATAGLTLLGGLSLRRRPRPVAAE